MKTNAAERVVVAADFSPDNDGIRGAREKVIALATEFKGTGVIIKLNAILRACGYNLIDELHELELD